MKHFIKYFTILFLVSTSSYAQNIGYIEYMENLLSNSTQVLANKEQLTADSLGLRKGLTPVDPKVDIDVFTTGGFEANLDFELDMPSVYHQRNKISKLGIERAQLGYKLHHQELLVELSDNYIDLIHNYKKKAIIETIAPLDSLNLIPSRLDYALENGTITELDYTEIQITYMNIIGLIQECDKNITILTNKIRTIKSDFHLDTYNLELPVFDFEDITCEEFIEKAYSMNPIRNIVEKDSILAQRELKLSKWEWAPKIIVGGRLDKDNSHNYTPGVKAGFTIPLWEMKGNIKHAKALTKVEKINKQNIEKEQKSNFKELYETYRISTDKLRVWRNYDAIHYGNIINKAYTAGVITTFEYVQQFNRLFENLNQMLEFQKLQALSGAKMTILLNT